ncbi:MAG: nucleotidyltransferase [Flavipsychrobacter sp.]|nr:nucleotidyltransferase [Flavipsychrobacter sp.]
MGDLFNDDFRDFINALNNQQVEYILVGGLAVALHGYRRPTGDMDIWVNKTKDNYLKLVKAFSEFGLSIFDMTEERFLGDVVDVFTFGRSPVSIDIMAKLKGLEFEDVFQKAQFFNEDGINIRFIHLNGLIDAKKAAGRYKDLDDIEKLSDQ